MKIMGGQKMGINQAKKTGQGNWCYWYLYERKMKQERKSKTEKGKWTEVRVTRRRNMRINRNKWE